MARPTLIFVPGFLGSTLTATIARFVPLDIWLSAPALIAGRFRDLAFDPGTTTPSTGLGRTIAPGLPIGAYYGTLLSYLSVRGWLVLSPGGDWRKPIADDAVRLLTTIRNNYTGSPIKILCHSRGGLVAREALKLLDDLGKREYVDRVVGLGVPHTGSVNACIALACWDSLKTKLENLGKALPGQVSSFLGLDSIRDVMRTWPGLYELLPYPTAAWVQGVPPQQLYLADVYFGGQFNPIQSWLSAASARWASAAPVPAWVDWIDIAGRGINTSTGFPSREVVITPGSTTTTKEGDGTVPIASAAESPRRRIITPTDHNLLPLDARLFRHIHNALTAGLAADVVLPGAVLELPGSNRSIG